MQKTRLRYTLNTLIPKCLWILVCFPFRRESNPLRKQTTIPQINRFSLMWNNSNEVESEVCCNSSSNYEESSNSTGAAYSPLPLPMPILMQQEAENRNRKNSASPMPISYQTSLMQMSSNQYYLVVQINVNENGSSATADDCNGKPSSKHVYENYP